MKKEIVNDKDLRLEKELIKNFEKSKKSNKADQYVLKRKINYIFKKYRINNTYFPEIQELNQLEPKLQKELFFLVDNTKNNSFKMIIELLTKKIYLKQVLFEEVGIVHFFNDFSLYENFIYNLNNINNSKVKKRAEEYCKKIEEILEKDFLIITNIRAEYIEPKGFELFLNKVMNKRSNNNKTTILLFREDINAFFKNSKSRITKEQYENLRSFASKYEIVSVSENIKQKDWKSFKNNLKSDKYQNKSSKSKKGLIFNEETWKHKNFWRI